MEAESSAPKSKKPYKELNLEEKVGLIRMAQENPRMSQAELAKIYGIAKSNVCRILKRRQEYLTVYECSSFSGARKRKLRDSETTELNMMVAWWLKARFQKGDTVTGSLIQEKARELAQLLNIPNFVASNGWLQSFQKSYFSHNSEISSTGNETLRAHMYKQHQISRMFMCRCCNWAFPDKTSLHIHMQAMANGNPGTASNIIAKSSVSPGTGFPAPDPPSSTASGIFPTIPPKDDFFQRLRERALANGAQAGLSWNLATMLGNFPKVDASGVGCLGGTLSLNSEDGSLETEDGNNNSLPLPGIQPELGEHDEGPEKSQNLDSQDNFKEEEDMYEATAEDETFEDFPTQHSLSKLNDLPVLRSAISSSPLNSLLYKRKLHHVLRNKAPENGSWNNGNSSSSEHFKLPSSELDSSICEDSDVFSNKTERKLRVASPPESHSSSPGAKNQSPRAEERPPSTVTCFACQVLRGKLGLSENRNRFLEGKVTSLESKVSRLESRLATLDANTRGYEKEGKCLREQNEQLQRRLMECQEKALGFLQQDSNDRGAIQQFLAQLLQSTTYLA